MTIDKAIEILETWQKQTHGRLISDYKDAVQLGIEALKDKLKARSHGHAYSSKPLPGETTD